LCVSVDLFDIVNVTAWPTFTVFFAGKKARVATPFLSLPA
jgi:hypothetical protein